MFELCDSQKLLLNIISVVLLSLVVPYIVWLVGKQRFPEKLEWRLIIVLALIAVAMASFSAAAETKLCDEIHITKIVCDSTRGDKGITVVVTLQNLDSHSVDLDEWKLCDYQNKHCYQFQHFKLPAQASVDLWTTIGTNTNKILYWNSKSAIWDDGDDTATLLDKKGRLVDQLACPPPPTPTVTPSPTFTLTPSSTPTIAQSLTPSFTPTFTHTPTSTFTSTAEPELVRYDIPSEGFYSVGPADAPITIIEFSDYQCPFCKRWHNEVYEQLLAAYPGKIKFVYRNLPLTSIHPDAQGAAEAAMCAGEQDAYWPFHEKLFSGDGLGPGAYIQYAQELNLNMTIFEACVTDQKYQAAVQADSDFAVNLGIRSTPTFFINGLVIVGAQPLYVFKQVIDKELTGEIPTN